MNPLKVCNSLSVFYPACLAASSPSTLPNTLESWTPAPCLPFPAHCPNFTCKACSSMSPFVQTLLDPPRGSLLPPVCGFWRSLCWGAPGRRNSQSRRNTVKGRRAWRGWVSLFSHCSCSPLFLHVCGEWCEEKSGSGSGCWEPSISRICLHIRATGYTAQSCALSESRQVLRVCLALGPSLHPVPPAHAL